MRTNPHILEINTHAWFKRIQNEIGADITIADIPEAYLFEIKEMGFDAIWLMGVWQESPASRQIARNDEGINNYLSKVQPDYSQEDIIGSQYSIYGYSVNPIFGGDEALIKLKHRLNEFGVSLILDFAGNHLSIDHPLTLTDPDIFIQSTGSPQERTSFYQTANGNWLAYGRDPHFPPWTDSVQINHFSPKARKFLLETLIKVAGMCDGLRCDMVMLMLNSIFKSTWGHYVKDPTPEEEFWPNAIAKVKEKYPFFTFMAEVYWGLEWEVQELGFDYTYDKILYDRLLLSNAQDIQGHLNAEHLYQKRSVRFIANHDEEAPVTAFGYDKSKAAAVVAATITGARLFTICQIYGEERRLPIQYVPKSFKKDEVICKFYHELLSIINHPCFHGGQWTLKHPKPIKEKDEAFKNILAWAWTQQSTCKIIVINYSTIPSKFILPMDKLPNDETLIINEEFAQTMLSIPTIEAKKNGIAMELAPFESKILSIDF